MRPSITRAFRLIRKLDPISAACDAVAGMYLLLMWSQINGDHYGEKGQ